METLINYQDGLTGQRILNFCNRLDSKLINFEIEITIKTLNQLNKQRKEIINRLKQELPRNIVLEFDRKQTVSVEKCFKKIKNTNINKFNKLKSEQHNLNMLIPDSWIKNLTTINIPDDVLKFLALGFKFSVAPDRSDISIKGLLASFENIITQLPTEVRDITRAKFTNIFTNYLKKPGHINYLGVLFSKTKQFLRDHGELVVTRADKGNVTVILTKEMYLELANNILQDQNYYRQLTNDPTSSYQQKANKLVSKLKKQKELSEEMAKGLTIYNQTSPKFYGLPKVHKPTLSLRPIISSINAPNSKLALLLKEILTNAYNTDNEYYVKDSFQFAGFMNEKQLPPNFVVLSLDVVSLYSNIPYSLVTKSINKHWERIKLYTALKLNTFIELLMFIFESTYFKFNNTYYKQILGTPMGATLSPILSQYVMDDLLEDCLPKLTFKPPFLKKFVDDLITAVPSDKTNEILQVFNSYNRHIQFTIEHETNMSVPFLDTKLVRNEKNQIILDWYVKPTNSGRYINYHSYHTTKIKINLILALKTRIEKISHHTLLAVNLNKLYNILLTNSYPKNLLKKLIFSTSQLVNLEQTTPPEITPDISAFITPTQKLYFSLPCVKEINNSISKLFESQPLIKIAHKHIKTVGSIYSKLKDKDEQFKKSNVVYSIPCSQCEGTYVGQTSRVLKDRLTSHKSDCRLNKKSCALSQHYTERGHDFDFNNTKVLSSESNYNKRLFLEMVEISKQPNALNKKTDINDLSIIYTHILNINTKNNTSRLDSDL